MKNQPLWKPRASLEILRARARLYAVIRAYFEALGVLEVETPILSCAATVDPNIDSYATRDGRWLQTSPEFAMKRLLAAGSGPIYQIAHAFRVDEAGRHHNPEFTLLEWYRPGYDHHQLMDEVEALLRAIGIGGTQPFERLSYREAFVRHAGLDPHASTLDELHAACAALRGGVPEAPAHPPAALRDFHLDLLMSQRVGPLLGVRAPMFLYDFPASQAALARVRADEPPVAERFELFWHGIELANGFHELTHASEQQRRFEQDRAQRLAQRGEAPPYDAHLIEALTAGLPDCAGVALGLDRLLMLMHGLEHVGDTLAFDAPRA